MIELYDATELSTAGGLLILKKGVDAIDAALAAAPAQPGEGEPSAREALGAVRLMLECTGPTHLRSLCSTCVDRARALLERRGGKGLSGEGIR